MVQQRAVPADFPAGPRGKGQWARGFYREPGGSPTLALLLLTSSSSPASPLFPLVPSEQGPPGSVPACSPTGAPQPLQGSAGRREGGGQELEKARPLVLSVNFPDCCSRSWAGTCLPQRSALSVPSLVPSHLFLLRGV